MRNEPHLPAVALEALAHVLGEGEIGVAIDSDAIVIVEGLKKASRKTEVTLEKVGAEQSQTMGKPWGRSPPWKRVKGTVGT